MTTKHRTRGFVFKKTDVAEADRIFSVVTEDFGRLEIRGKAIRKINSKLRAGVDLFCFSEIEFIQGKNNKTLTVEAKIDVKKAEEAREKAKISEQLNKFKGDNSPDQGDALASKMPMREEYKDDNFQKIKIPVAKKNFQESTGIAASSPKSIDQADQKEKPGLLQEKPDLLKDKLKPATTDNALERGGSVMFGNKQEITRRELKYKLWKDPKVYKAARESLLYLSPTERVKLEKELFPKAYGLNISKSDIKTRMRKLSQKMINEKNPQAKATLRKKIKFIKKIGGA
ncbi:MAG: hypothetical protein A2599_01815 [Candidatus Staskawiczbacteria bacterium RIFOXYD1_FULL_39_28]|nr:MAG: hypothetical protein A2599_01815 [Candidatus Staskawiczbacteria bacterium RIFOXYD1_FULL_39_28]